MSAAPNPDAFVLVIDTRSYAGNFEREMCAFVTGAVGECNVGYGIALAAREDLAHNTWYEEHISQQPDDEEYPCLRPASIWPTPGRMNNGRGFHADDTPEMRKEFGFPATGEVCPAYESVAIFMDIAPPSAVFAEMKARILEYGVDKNIQITGIRLLAPKYEQKSISVVANHREIALP